MAVGYDEEARLGRRCLGLVGLLDGEEIMRRTTSLLTEEFGFDMSWVGVPAEAGAIIRHTSGNRTHLFHGLLLRSGLGLGGKVFASGRLQWTDDYLSSPHITHEYDIPIAAEQVQRVIAAPMVIGEQNFGVLLAGYRDRGACGDRAAGIVEAVADRCLQALSFAERARAAVEEAMYAERRRTALELNDTIGAMLRSIAANTRAIRETPAIDPDLRYRLQAIERQAGEVNATMNESFLDLFAPGDGLRGTAEPVVHRGNGRPIAKREYDVLRRVATGETNLEIAEAMGLSCNTIKTYLRNVMSKLDARNRVEAIVHAREMGLL